MMRTKLTGPESIQQVLREMTLDEKLNLVGEYSACHTLAIPDMDIPALCLMDGVTGVNGTQGLLDFITSRELSAEPEAVADLYGAIPELMKLNYEDLSAAKAGCTDPHRLALIERFEHMRPGGKQHISFPSGINIGASFDPDTARQIGAAVGWEMRAIGVDVVLGPNVDIYRDPLSGRGYEMYSEDPYVVEEMGAAFIEGVQSTGTAACAKHFLANNQETNRNTKDTHVSWRALREIYGRGFEAAIKKARVKSIMTAYNAINGEFTSFSKKLLNDWLREEWGYDGMICCDWGAVKEDKEKSLAVGMDLILCGPNDMSGVRKAIEDKTFSEDILDGCVSRILKLIVDIKNEQNKKPLNYKTEDLLHTACRTITDGSVLLKNDGGLLPLAPQSRLAVYGKRSKNMFECGTGSTAVISGLHSNVYDECQKHFQWVSYEDMEGADTLVYTVTAVGGENIDRSEMNIEKEDRERLPRILKEAKTRGLRTVVLLNISGPVDMRSWIDDADSILTIFIPGCMGGVAAGRLLCGQAYPGGKLPVTFPLRYEDTPSYPNFPGEHNDVYYGEGIFVGYRYYEKRKAEVLFPFGFGLSYTSIEARALENEFRMANSPDAYFEIPVTLTNTGSRPGCQVIQVYGAEERPHVLRPQKELVAFKKVCLEPGEQKLVKIKVSGASLRYFDIKKNHWVYPAGKILLYMGTSSADIFARAWVHVDGINEYALSGESTVGEIMAYPEAMALIDAYTGGMFENSENLAFMVDTRLDDLLRMALISSVPDAVRLDTLLKELYEKLGRL